MIQEYAIRQKLGDLLRGDLPIDSFEDWLVSGSWNMHLDSTVAAQRLVSAIETRLFEYSSAHLTDDELLAKLSELARQISFDIEITPRARPTYYSTASSHQPSHRSLLQI